MIVPVPIILYVASIIPEEAACILSMSSPCGNINKLYLRKKLIFLPLIYIMVKKTEIHIMIVTIVLVIVFRPIPVRAFDLQPSQSEIAASDALTLQERARGQCVDCTAPLATNNSLLESIQATDSLYTKCLKWDYQLGLIRHLLEAGRRIKKYGQYSS
jgi:hypothetical protein